MLAATLGHPKPPPNNERPSAERNSRVLLAFRLLRAGGNVSTYRISVLTSTESLTKPIGSAGFASRLGVAYVRRFPR